MKRCSRCKKLKPDNKFSKLSRSKDGLHCWCIECLSEYGREYRKRGRGETRRNLKYEETHRVVDGVKQKRCNRCKQWKDEGEYGRYLRGRDGLYGACKKCESKRLRKYFMRGRKYVKKHYRYAQTHRVVEGVKQKRCRKCMKWKPESEFFKHRYSKDGLDVWCSKCNLKAQWQRKARKKAKRKVKRS